MKTISKFLMVFTILITTAIASNAQVRVFVRTRPVEPVFVRPPAPYRDAVWIPGEWRWEGRRYVYVNPHYQHLRRGHVWVSGHWNNIRGGSVWVGGYWR
ncbi:YXWGXW repeat-containing protein [Mucilaginibacter gracilis]|uniref:YXWGXW repeat-containing protein n=1 Tax=Mucilaginibacter gracilis TaxID=423350 RepID=A0A495J285_9SPHI|nr:YXWGXW repeat-containing protein [Mucilaginibacter gracilis]RKR82468.1 YXWGXW repeat-containing protein [Mucilaginibacter gracilis]